MRPSFSYDMPLKDMFLKALDYASIPALITLVLGIGNWLLPDFFGPAAIEIPMSFMSSKLMNFIGVVGLFFVGLSVGATTNSVWYRLCKFINLKVMELSFSVLSAMLGVGCSVLIILFLAESSGFVRMAGTVALIGIVLVAQLVLGKLVFAARPYWHNAMNGAPRVLPRIAALMILAALVNSLMDTIRP